MPTLVQLGQAVADRLRRERRSTLGYRGRPGRPTVALRAECSAPASSAVADIACQRLRRPDPALDPVERGSRLQLLPEL